MAAKTKWIRIFILCGTITVQTKYHRCLVPRLEVMYFCRCYCDIFTSQAPYFDLHRPSLDPSHSFVMSYVGTAVLRVADLLTLQTGRALTAAGLRCSYYVTHYSTHPSPPFPAGSATTRRSGINKLSAASASPTCRPALVVIQPTTETRP